MPLRVGWSRYKAAIHCAHCGYRSPKMTRQDKSNFFARNSAASVLMTSGKLKEVTPNLLARRKTMYKREALGRSIAGSRKILIGLTLAIAGILLSALQIYAGQGKVTPARDRKSTRLNSS